MLEYGGGDYLIVLELLLKLVKKQTFLKVNFYF